jgi:hypothetical protein
MFPQKEPEKPRSPQWGFFLWPYCASHNNPLTFVVQCNKWWWSTFASPILKGFPEMFEPFQKASEDLQKMGKDNYDAVLRSYGELGRGFQAIGARVTDYSKRAFEDATRAFEQVIGAKSLEHAIEIQSQYAKKAYDTWVAEASKLGELYAAVASDAYKPVEKAVAKRTA